MSPLRNLHRKVQIRVITELISLYVINYKSNTASSFAVYLDYFSVIRLFTLSLFICKQDWQSSVGIEWVLVLNSHNNSDFQFSCALYCRQPQQKSWFRSVVMSNVSDKIVITKPVHQNYIFSCGILSNVLVQQVTISKKSSTFTFAHNFITDVDNVHVSVIKTISCRFMLFRKTIEKLFFLIKKNV